MMKFFLFLPFLLLLSCQMKPTVVKNEATDQYEKDVVLVDTREALQYESYHVSGSVHLQTSDFLILKNPLTKEKVFDPDLNQTIERLAKKGISPEKRIILVSDSKESLENKKWHWLFKKIGVTQVGYAGLSYFKGRIPQEKPESVATWTITNAAEILKKSKDCFIKWSAKDCN